MPHTALAPIVTIWPAQTFASNTVFPSCRKLKVRRGHDFFTNYRKLRVIQWFSRIIETSRYSAVITNFRIIEYFVLFGRNKSRIIELVNRLRGRHPAGAQPHIFPTYPKISRIFELANCFPALYIVPEKLPSFNGVWSRTKAKYGLLVSATPCLNPSFNGIWSRIAIFSIY